MKAELNDADNATVRGYERIITGELNRVMFGRQGVTEIRYHTPIGEGDKHYLDVYVDGKLYMREFDIGTIYFGAQEREKENDADEDTVL